MGVLVESSTRSPSVACKAETVVHKIKTLSSRSIKSGALRQGIRANLLLHLLWKTPSWTRTQTLTHVHKSREHKCKLSDALSVHSGNVYITIAESERQGIGHERIHDNVLAAARSMLAANECSHNNPAPIQRRRPLQYRGASQLQIHCVRAMFVYFFSAAHTHALWHISKGLQHSHTERNACRTIYQCPHNATATKSQSSRNNDYDRCATVHRSPATDPISSYMLQYQRWGLGSSDCNTVSFQEEFLITIRHKAWHPTHNGCVAPLEMLHSETHRWLLRRAWGGVNTTQMCPDEAFVLTETALFWTMCGTHRGLKTHQRCYIITHRAKLTAKTNCYWQDIYISIYSCNVCNNKWLHSRTQRNLF